MRLKEDTSSWNSSGIIKRDFRHDHSQPSGPTKHKAKKNTGKWCKGKVGVPHQYESKVPTNDSFKFRKMDICKNCGRQQYTNVKYWCRHHEVWDNHVFWNDGHTHQEAQLGAATV